MKGAKSPFRVQSSSFLNLKSSENWTGSGAKRLFRHAEMPSLWMAFHMALKHDGSHSQFVKTKSHPSEAVVEPRVRCGPAISTKNTIQRMVFFFGDPYGNRTHVTAVKGRCLNRLTNGPGSGNLTRTDDTPGMNRMLYQLSYAAIYCCVSQQEILYRQRCDLSTTFVRFFRGFRKFFLPHQPIRPKRRPGRGPRRAHGGADYADLRPRRRP